MYVDMTCGFCDSTFVLDGEEEAGAWVLVLRFANAHVTCGFMTPAPGEEPNLEVREKRIVRKPRRDEVEEEED